MNFTAKTAAAGIGGAVGIVAVWIVNILLAILHSHIQLVPETMPGEVAASVASIFSTVASYFAPRSEPTAEQIAAIKQQQQP